MSRRRQAWIVLGCLAVLLLLVAMQPGCLAFLQARFHAAVAAYRAAGEPMSEAELGWPERADSDNIATGLAGLVDQSVTMIPAEQRGWIDRMWEQPSGSAEDASSNRPLTEPEPQHRAARDLVLQLAPSAAEADAEVDRFATRAASVVTALASARFPQTTLSNDR